MATTRPHNPWADQKTIAILVELSAKFGVIDPSAYISLVFRQRFGRGKHGCPHCHRMSDLNYKAKKYVCEKCALSINPLVGTPMYRSHIPIHQWFEGMHLFMSGDKVKKLSPINVAAHITNQDLAERFGLSLKLANRMRWGLIRLVYPILENLWE